MFKKLIQKIYQWKFKGGLDEKMQEKDQQNNFVLGWGFLRGEYVPKNTCLDDSVLMEIINQQGLNICVCVSGTNGKQIDEQVLLDYQFAAAYLTSIGKMGSQGTSLTAFQDMLRKVGIPRRGLPINNNQSFSSYASKSILTQQRYDDATNYKIESYYQTYDLNKVLEELDNKRPGHAGSTWYSGYNPSQLPDTCVITPYSGYAVGGHATLILSYNLNYYGYKVLKCVQSYGDYHHFFYVKFEDFNKVFNYGVCFNSDIKKDLLGWLSVNDGKCILEKNGNKVYFIESDKKRYVKDIALMTMLGFTPANLVHDIDNYLPEVRDGDDVTFEDIPVEIREKTKYILQQTKNQDLNLKELWSQYFTDI